MALVKRLENDFDPEGPKTVLVHQDGGVRVVRFYLKEGQEIKPHRSKHQVIVTVLSGRLRFLLGDREDTLNSGTTVIYEPEELHGFTALEDSVVEALIILCR
ncbi:MAG: cupin domain-containing protein [Aquificota bacterium]|nr:cupin domain-containing protein [Aquificota bacterium]MDQ7082624.1 cupin domain-containing protein [Aquificota bacterium]